ncbi:MAG: type II toxin-antitoxin system death-on-curing family toxin [Chloroflexota bacterium]
MVAETIYLDVADVVALHNVMMERLGLRPEPLRDAGLLESALLKPQMAAHYEQADLVRQATLLAVGIAQNQPLVDGNKRTAYTISTMFLRQNGLLFQGDIIEMADQLILLAERTDGLDATTRRFEAWLRERVAEQPH